MSKTATTHPEWGAFSQASSLPTPLAAHNFFNFAMLGGGRQYRTNIAREVLRVLATEVDESALQAVEAASKQLPHHTPKLPHVNEVDEELERQI